MWVYYWIFFVVIWLGLSAYNVITVWYVNDYSCLQVCMLKFWAIEIITDFFAFVFYFLIGQGDPTYMLLAWPCVSESLCAYENVNEHKGIFVVVHFARLTLAVDGGKLFVSKYESIMWVADFFLLSSGHPTFFHLFVIHPGFSLTPSSQRIVTTGIMRMYMSTKLEKL